MAKSLNCKANISEDKRRGLSLCRYPLGFLWLAMDKKVIDLSVYKIERALKKDGYTIKKDKEKKIKVLLRINK